MSVYSKSLRVAAIGANLPISEATGSMDGGGTSEIAMRWFSLF